MSAAKQAVFLSYASQDAAAAKRIADALRGFGVEVWFDQEELRGGDQWDAKIRGQIKACGIFVPIISKTTEARDEAYFRREWKLADDRTQDMAPGKAFIVPVVIDDTPEYGATVPDSFNKAQWTRLPGGEPTTAFIDQIRRLTQPKPSGIVSAAQASASPTAATPRRKGTTGWIWAAIGTVVVAVAVGTVVFLNRMPAAPPARPSDSGGSARPEPARGEPAESAERAAAPAKSIAVLPFENRSDNKEDLYFTDGFHDDLITQISHIHDIKTISRTSVMAYRDTTKNMRTIGEELGVSKILEGGVQRAGNQIRINVQLIDAATDAHLWAETYTRELTAQNVFAIQSEIATAVTNALKAVLSPEEKQQLDKLPTENVAALEAFFRAKASLELGTVAGNEAAIAHLKEALRLDPDFALAHAKLGETLLDQVYLAGLPNEDQVAAAEPHILRAVALDGTSSEATSALGYLRQRQGRSAEAESAYQRAIELNPNNAGAYQHYIAFLEYTVGDAAAVARVLQRYLQLDPNSDTAQDLRAARLTATGQLQEALQLREAIAAQHPDSVWAQRSLGHLYVLYFGRHDDAIIALRKAYALDPRNPGIARDLAWTYAALGDAEGAYFWRDRYKVIRPGPNRSMGLESLLSDALGDKATAERLALEAVATNPYDGYALWFLLNVDIGSGHPEKSRERYLKAYPGLFQPGAKVNAANFWNAKDVARVLFATGEREQADYLIGKVLSVAQSVTSTTDALLLQAIAHAVAGHDLEALQAVKRYLEAGGPTGELINREEEFTSLRKYPEFQDMIDREKSRMTAQLARIKRMEAAGELAPIPPLPDSKNDNAGKGATGP